MADVYGLDSDVFFGAAETELPDWRSAKDADVDADDEQLEVTPADVVAALGFDPLDLDEPDEEPSSRYRLRLKTWDEEKHPRGDSDNAGQFVKKGAGGAKAKGKAKKPAKEPKAADVPSGENGSAVASKDASSEKNPMKMSRHELRQELSRRGMGDVDAELWSEVLERERAHPEHFPAYVARLIADGTEASSVFHEMFSGHLGGDMPPPPKKIVAKKGQTKLAAAVADAIGRPVSNEDAVAMAGASAGDEVSHDVEGGKVSVSVSNEFANWRVSFSRGIEGGADTVHLDAVFIDPSAQGQGRGTELFHKIATTAAKAGIKQIDLFAAGSDGDEENGYYTWARLGADASIPRPLKKKAQKSGLGAVEFVSDLMVTPEGRAWWKKNGSALNMTFELRSDSTSMKVLEAYVKEKASKKKSMSVLGDIDEELLDKIWDRIAAERRSSGDEPHVNRYRLRLKSFNEEEHPRGDPDNPGQFVKKGTGGVAAKRTKKPAPVPTAKATDAAGFQKIVGALGLREGKKLRIVDADGRVFVGKALSRSMDGSSVQVSGRYEGKGEKQQLVSYSLKKLPASIEVFEKGTKLAAGEMPEAPKLESKSEPKLSPTESATKPGGHKWGVANTSLEFLGEDYKQSAKTEGKARKLLGGKVVDNLSAICGNVPGCDVRAYFDKQLDDVLVIESRSGSYGETSVRRLYRDDNGDLALVNERFVAGEQHKGAGTMMFASQVEAASRMGVKKITTVAGGGPGTAYNGYYTWPRLGYDTEIEKLHPNDREQLAEDFPGKKFAHLSDLLQTPEGRDWWKKNGASISVSFDLSPSSNSLKVLHEYVAAKAEQTGSAELRAAADALAKRRGVAGQNLGQSKKP